MSLEISNELKQVAEQIYALGKEADYCKAQIDKSHFLSDIAKGKLQSQYAEKVREMNFLTSRLSLADILRMDDYLNEKYEYRS